MTPKNAVTVRYLRASSIQKMFEKHGYNIKCDAVEAKHMLVVAGPAVDEGFVNQFLSTPPLLKGAREVGFSVIGFWQGPFQTGTHLRDFALGAPVGDKK